MKQYGFNFATEFTSKQISVIYGMAKRGELNIEKWVIKDFYDLADYYGMDSNRSVADCESDILRILEAVFAKDAVKAQELIDSYTERKWDRLGRKVKEQCDRTMM